MTHSPVTGTLAARLTLFFRVWDRGVCPQGPRKAAISRGNEIRSAPLKMSVRVFSCFSLKVLGFRALTTWQVYEGSPVTALLTSRH